ncbi:glutamine amidotransferase [Cellvibrio sp. NN19]|uniref:glutamine amidotransferase n=1 Tax=Cellvibrio chitinivorans TaxID=3102792 RepID=UPI002B40926E|nr:glutamine amidotransferase [Cellvibrio sp. NN19]
MQSDKPLLIIQTGKTFSDISKTQGDFADWIAAGLGNPPNQLHINAWEVDAFPSPSTIAGAVLSGSHAMVTDCEYWSERLAVWLRTCVEEGVPVLGICYGHQLLAHAMSGEVGYRVQGIEIGTHTVSVTENAAEDVLFKNLPAQFPAQLVHSQSVLSLPPSATLLASSADEPHQAFRIGNCAWGVQFHPEFSATAMRGYIQQKSDYLIEQQQNPETLIAAVQETPQASALLQHFAKHVAGFWKS